MDKPIVDRLTQKHRSVESDGWIHREPESPAQRGGTGLLFTCSIGFGVLLIAYDYHLQSGPVGFAMFGYVQLFLTFLAFLVHSFSKPFSAMRYNYCPDCARRTPYDPTQFKCLCGYTTPSVNRGLKIVVALALAFLLWTPIDSTAQSLPVTQVAPVEQDEAVPLVNAYDIYDEFFQKDMVAKDVTPEFLALVNKPSLELAVAAYQKQILNIATFMQAVRYYEATRGYYEDLLERKYALTLERNPQEFYRQMLAEFGYQDVTIELPEALQPYDPMALTNKNVADYLRRSLANLPTSPGGQ